MPSLDLQALRQHIQQNRLAPIYVFVGEDVKLADRMVRALEETVDAADRPFAVDHLYAGEEGGTATDIATAASSLPMLGTRRLVVVKRAERLLKPKRASRTAGHENEGEPAGEGEVVETEALEDYVASPAPFATVVFVALEVDRTRRLTKKLLDKALFVEFRGLAADGASARREGSQTTAEWLTEELTRAGRTIDREASRLLVDRAAHDISKLRGDIERLVLFTQGRPGITVDDVMEVSAEEHAVDDEWGVVNAIAEGHPSRALDEVGRRLERGDSPHALIGQLRWWVSSRLAEGGPERVPAALDALLRTDLALKSSGGDDRVLLERLVVELTGRPLPTRGWGGRR